MGDLVSAVGVLSAFNNNLELACFVTTSSAFFSPYAYAVVNNSINSLPPPLVFAPYSQTNNAPLMETNIEGKVVMLTNVWFTTPGTVTGTGSTTTTTTNAAGEPILVFFPGTQDQDIRGRTLPGFCWTITGIMSQFKSGAYSSAGYEVNVTRWGDILTNPPPAVTAAASLSGNNVVLNWTAVPYVTNYNTPGAYAYSVLAASSVTGPYVPLASGLTFSTANGVYTDTPGNGSPTTLSGANEVPPNGSTATGTGSVVLSADGTTITVNMSFSGLSAPATAAHIHGPAGAGTNAAVEFPFSGVPNATSGSIPQQSFAITPTHVGYLKNGLLYMNVHDANFPGGEIRGQLVPASTRFYRISSP